MQVFKCVFNRYKMLPVLVEAKEGLCCRCDLIVQETDHDDVLAELLQDDLCLTKDGIVTYPIHHFGHGGHDMLGLVAVVMH